MATSKSTTEQNNVAIASKDSAKYFGELSFADLMAKKAEADALNAQLAAALEVKRVEEIKVLADAYAKKAQAAGFSIREALDALEPYLPAKASRKQRAAKGSAPKREVAFVRGTTYKDPSGEGKDWTAGGLGAKPKWLKLLVDDLSTEEQKKKYEELAAK